MRKISTGYYPLLFTAILFFFQTNVNAQKATRSVYNACHNCVYAVKEGVFFDDGGESGPVSSQPQTTTFKTQGNDGQKLKLFFSQIDIPAGSKLVIFYKNKDQQNWRSEVFHSLKKTKNIIAEEITVEYYPSDSRQTSTGWVGHLSEIFAEDQVNAKIASQPESDCPYAIPLCTNNTAVALGGLYEDLGAISDDAGSCYSGTGDGGSVWYSFTPLSNGPIDFYITPQGTTDYDFVLWDITDGCASGDREELACNYSLYTGATGMSGTLCSENVGSCSNNTCSNQSKAAECNRFNGRVNVSTTRRYAICINFYSGSNDGFVIKFQNEQGSVAISDNTPPTITNAYADNCTSASNLHLTFSEWVDCSTIQSGDFTLAGHTFTVISTNCEGDKTNSVDISVSPALGPGTHVIRAQNILDLCGNTMNSSYSVVLGTPPTPTISTPVAVCKNPDILGFTYSPSSQVLTAGGGTSYEWSTGETSASISVSPTSTKTFSVKVFENGCFETISTTVVVREAQADLGPDKYYCGNPVTLTASPTGQGFTYQFYRAPNFISNGTLIQEGASSSVAVSPTSTTTYRVIVTDANGCKARDDIRVIVPSGSNATINVPGNNYCTSANPIELTAVPEGGTFSGPGVSGNIFNPSVAGVGTHTISYTAVNECGTFTGTKTITVVSGNLPNINLNSTYCVSDADVTFTPSPTCGTLTGTGIVFLTGICIGNTYIVPPQFSPSQAGVGEHVITYTPPANQGYCTNSTTVTVIGEGFDPTITGADGPYCANASPVTLTGTPAGGVFTGRGMTGSTFNPATAGVGTHTITYTVTQCSNRFSSSIQIEVLSSSPTATMSYAGSPYCASTSTSQSITFSGTTGGTYSASPSGLSINATTGAIIPSQSNQGTYTVTYTIPASGGCPTFTKTATVTITNSITPEFNIPEVICLNSTPPVLPSTSSNNISGIWDPATVSNTNPGTYTFTPNAGQCSAPVDIDIDILPAPEVDAQASETLVEPGTEVQLSAEPQTKGVFYSWSPPEAVSDPNSSSPTAVVTEDTWFYVTAYYEQGECSAIDSVLVQVRRDNECEDFNIFLPSAFTPNGDGQNDVYRVKSVIPLESMTLMIFNRWGEKVFETNDQGISWDGTYNGKPAAADAYGYYFEGICNGTTFKKQGNITIVR